VALAAFTHDGLAWIERIARQRIDQYHLHACRPAAPPPAAAGSAYRQALAGSPTRPSGIICCDACAKSMH
jgi:hypothetical protein